MYATPPLAPPVPKEAAPRSGRRVLAMLGPAFVAAVAYVDPGNFATNVAAGSTYGCLLVWVVVLSNVVAMLIQYLSAKAGIATGRSLPALCREQVPRWLVWPLWAQAEVVAIATDLAEVVGGALALRLLFGVPVVAGGTITAIVSFALLRLTRSGHRSFEIVVIGLLAVIGAGFAYGLIIGGPPAGEILHGTVPRLPDDESVLLVAGMVGATVMPHAIYLHGGLTGDRFGSLLRATAGRRRALLHAQRLDVVVAMTLAGAMNLALLLVAAGALGGRHIDTIEGAHAGFSHVLGNAAGLSFALALLASGLAASSVGTLAGQVVMDGFIKKRIPLVVRRGLTLAPALVVLTLGVDPTRALVASQVVLSFGIPFALIPLVAFTRRRDLMGELCNRRVTTALAAVVSAVIVTLNGCLLLQFV